MAAIPHDLARALADRYRLERELGSGGMATVYLAEDVKHRRKVAVKVLRPEVAAGLGSERFVREIRLAASLTHPHILPLHDSGEAGGFLFYVMPYIEGESLRARLTRDRELPITEAVRILRDVADALASAHKHGVVHRDIKPDNVLLIETHAVVTDFGVAKALSEATGKQQLTTAGVALGTPAYMAPEQATADPQLDHRVDVYALGVLAYEMLAGRQPFTGTTAQELLAAQVTQAPRPITAHRQSVPAALEQLVMKCLEKKPADRWQTAAELLPQLEALTTPSGGVSPTAARIPAMPSAGRRMIIRWAAPVAVFLAMFFGWRVLSSPDGGRPGGADESLRVAVMPFENLVPDGDDEYFSDGMTQDVNTQLSKLSGLVVIAHGSAKQYADERGGYADIASQLNVNYVVDGSVRRASGRIRVTVRLIDPRTDAQLWVEEYNRELSAADIFAIQSDVARQVAVALNTQLAAASAATRGPTENLEDYNEYLPGRFYWDKRTPESLNQALVHFSRAIDLDSSYAMAYAGLADVYSFRPWYAGDRAAEVYPRNKAAAERAVALDSTLAEAHASLALVRHQYEWDWARAASSFRRSLELNPRYAPARAWYGAYLAAIGEFDQAVAELERALEYDPLSANWQGIYGRVLLAAGRVEDALEHSQRGITQGFAALRIEIAFGHLALGRTAEAIRAAEASGNRTARINAYARGGQREMALQLVAELEATAQRQRVAPFTLAEAYLGIGDLDRAFRYLDLAVAERQPELAWYTLRQPRWEPARRDPRFATVMGAIGLDPEGRPLDR